MSGLFKSIIITYVLFFQVVYCAKSIPDILTKNRFSWVVDGVIAGIAMPKEHQQIEALLGLNIGLVVTLTESEKEGPDPKFFEGVDIERLLLPIQDFHIPTIEQIDKFIKKSKEVLQGKGKATVVHCMGGKGRTGTMLACWLVANKNMKPADAIMLVKNKRPGSIETDEQIKVVGKYYATLLSRKLKKLKIVDQKLKEWKEKSEAGLHEKVEKAKQKAHERELKTQESVMTADFYEGIKEQQDEIEKQKQLKKLRESLGNLKLSLVVLNGKLNGLQQKLLLLKAKLEQSKDGGKKSGRIFGWLFGK